MKQKVTGVFDIGKTNKKFFLFDENFKEVYREYTAFEEINDEDGFPSENLDALVAWVKATVKSVINNEKYALEYLNFSTYGASFVHIDKNGMPLTNLYNYLKPIDVNLEDGFYTKYGLEKAFSASSGSNKAGMLNSGLQLYWLKKTKPEIFSKISFSLHLPQYLSYIFTGIPKSDYTSIGCHTALWDFAKNDYQPWVFKEGINSKLAPISSSQDSTEIKMGEKNVQVGIGIHDSSAALLPYLKSINEKFILLSTGTWNVTLNPFYEFTEPIYGSEEVITYMQISGKAVKSARVFLGSEYGIQVKFLSVYFNLPEEFHKNIKFDLDIYKRIVDSYTEIFHWESLAGIKGISKTAIPYKNEVEAYHHLMISLVLIQVESIKNAVGNDNIGVMFVDGGFSDNDIFIKLLGIYFPEMDIKTTDLSLGSALGAAIVLSDKTFDSDFLNNNYAIKKHDKIIIK